jgi:hypothetical protein
MQTIIATPDCRGFTSITETAAIKNCLTCNTFHKKLQNKGDFPISISFCPFDIKKI